jgi:hypothetical protein
LIFLIIIDAITSGDGEQKLAENSEKDKSPDRSQYDDDDEGDNDDEWHPVNNHYAEKSNLMNSSTFPLFVLRFDYTIFNILLKIMS